MWISERVCACACVCGGGGADGTLSVPHAVGVAP